MNRRPVLAIAALAAAAMALTACTSSEPANPEDWPAQGTTIQWIVPSAAGGANDTLARIVGPVLAEELGATVNVSNVEGGNQVIGLSQLANAQPNGETIGYTNIPSIFGRYLDPGQNAAFDRESFTPIGSFASNAVIIAVPGSSPYETLTDLFDAVEDAPGELTFATDSRAGDDHINLRLLENALDLDFNIVHYNSGADKVAALVAGEVDAALGGVGSFYTQSLSGDLRILGVVADEPSQFLPDVPTLTSLGYDVEPMTNDFTVSVPAGTPEKIVSALESALEAASTDPEVIASFEDVATEGVWTSAADIAKSWKEREETVRPVIESILKEEG